MSAIERVVVYQECSLRGVPLYTQERDVDMQVLSLKSMSVKFLCVDVDYCITIL